MLTLLDHLAAIVSLVTQVIAVPYDLLYPTALNNVQLNSPVSGQPNCEDLMVAYGRWSFTRIEPKGVSSEKRSRYSYLMVDNFIACYL